MYIADHWICPDDQKLLVSDLIALLPTHLLIHLFSHLLQSTGPATDLEHDPSNVLSMLPKVDANSASGSLSSSLRPNESLLHLPAEASPSSNGSLRADSF